MNDLIDAVTRLQEAMTARSSSAARQRLVKAHEPAIAAAFKAQGRSFLARFRDARGVFRESQQEDEFDRAWADAEAAGSIPLASAIDAAAAAAFDSARQRLLDTVVAENVGLTRERAISFDLEHPLAVSWLERHGADRVTKINEVTRKRIREIVTVAARDGKGYDWAAEKIMDEFSAFAVGRPQEHIDSRAHLVAVTEVGDAYEEGMLRTGRFIAGESVTLEKSWITVGDERVDEGICGANADQGWIDLETAWQSGHERPLGHPACRCAMIMRVKEKV
jgi:hypothetical protein